MATPQERDVARFDHMATRYDRAPGQVFAHRIDTAVITSLAAGTASPSLIVDIGCGTGRLLASLRKQFPQAQLLGIDPARGMVAVARRRFREDSQVRLEVASATSIPLGNDGAAAVLSTLSFHHWDHQAASLTEIHRVLAPGGRLLLADILGIGPVGWLLRPLGRRHGSGYRDARELDAMLTSAGLTSWRHQRIFWPGVPIFLLEAEKRRLEPG
jgi:ubiquinone/menaquinone biosynthesis C-methylase UbiE